MWVYKITNKINGKIYVGQSHKKRSMYLGSGNLIKAAVNKYGKENFIKEWIDQALTQEELDKKEIYWIKNLNAQDKNIGYNIADGGWNAFTMNDETKKKISETLKGKYVGENAFRKGIKLSEEHKLAISEANKGRNKLVSEETRRKMSLSRIGIKYSDNTRRKMSESHKGKKLSIRHKLKISESIKGRQFSAVSIEKIRKSNMDKQQKHSIPVILENQDTGEILNFNNLSSAARYFDTSRHIVKNNKISGWEIQLGYPIVKITQLRNESTRDG